MRRAMLGWCLMGALILEATVALAHHSAVMFDDKQMIELTGIVKEFQYANPHAWLIVEVKNADGTTTTWGFEGPAGPSVLMRAGIHRGDFPPGTQVKVSGHPMRDGRPAAQWVKAVRLSDGKEFFPRAVS
jgi:uncharacterized protein DUF6152